MAAAIGWALSVEANGPWKAQIVDADTGRPLEGVVVVAIWTARSPGAIHPRSEFYDVDELVSDADGRIVIPARGATAPSKPGAAIVGPQILMFKAGYGRWGFRDVETRRAELKDAYAREEAFDREWAKFSADGVVIVLPRLRDVRERERFVFTLGAGGIPEERIPRFSDTVERERRLFGVRP